MEKLLSSKRRGTFSPPRAYLVIVQGKTEVLQLPNGTQEDEDAIVSLINGKSLSLHEMLVQVVEKVLKLDPTDPKSRLKKIRQKADEVSDKNKPIEEKGKVKSIKKWPNH